VGRLRSLLHPLLGPDGAAAPGRDPELPDYVMDEAYSHDCISAGWWPGGGALEDAAFYAYAYPEPDGCNVAPIRRAGRDASGIPAIPRTTRPPISAGGIEPVSK